MKTVLERFLHYVSFNTKSDEESPSCPSTPGQLVLGEALVQEMKAMGIADAAMDKNGYIMGTVPGDPSLPAIGLIAHMDTSPDCSGENIKARVMHYTGQDLCLNEEKSIWLRAADYPSLNDNVGKHLVVTDGTTLLGADDKAGVAEILTAVEQLIREGGKHATVKIGFTPDEEIGRGADLFDVAGFGADYAYTVDGGSIGELEYENFNAAGAKVEIFGVNIHPGSAKDKMKNAQLIAMEFNALLPADQRPEHTEGYEGFFHLTDMQGDVEKATLYYIIRDHDFEKFEEKKELLVKAGEKMNEKYGNGSVCVSVKDSYFNMKQMIEPCMFIVERAKSAMEAVGITPSIQPIRGGTDGARLSFEGLPCPNLCTGGENFHSRFEYVPVEDMERIKDLLIQLMTSL